MASGSKNLRGAFITNSALARTSNIAARRRSGTLARFSSADERLDGRGRPGPRNVEVETGALGHGHAAFVGLDRRRARRQLPRDHVQRTGERGADAGAGHRSVQGSISTLFDRKVRRRLRQNGASHAHIVENVDRSTFAATQRLFETQSTDGSGTELDRRLAFERSNQPGGTVAARLQREFAAPLPR